MKGCFANLNMKKKATYLFPVLFLALLLLIATGCGNGGDDKTVDVPGCFSREDYILSDTIANGTADYVKIYSDVYDLYPDSTTIVVGTVEDLTYSDADGIATTYYDLLVEDCWEGNVKKGDRITVAHNGGFVRNGNTLIKETIYNTPLPEKGDYYLLFLTNWCSGTYCALNTFMARYYISKDQTLYRFVPDEPYIKSEMDRGEDPTKLDEMKLLVLQLSESFLSNQPASLEENLNLLLRWEPFLDSNQDSQSLTEAYEEACLTLLEKTRLAVKNTTEKPTVLILSGESPFLAAGGDTFQNVIIEEAGCRNVIENYKCKGNFITLTENDLLQLNPDYIILPDTASYRLSDYPLFEQMTAGMNNQIIRIPFACEHEFYSLNVSLGRGDSGAFLAVAFLLSNIHESVYNRNQFVADAYCFATAYYGYEEMYIEEIEAYQRQWEETA